MEKKRFGFDARASVEADAYDDHEASRAIFAGRGHVLRLCGASFLAAVACTECRAQNDSRQQGKAVKGRRL